MAIYGALGPRESLLLFISRWKYDSCTSKECIFVLVQDGYELGNKRILQITRVKIKLSPSSQFIFCASRIYLFQNSASFFFIDLFFTWYSSKSFMSKKILQNCLFTFLLGYFTVKLFVEMYLVKLLEVSWQDPSVFIHKTQQCLQNILTYSGVIL